MLAVFFLVSAVIGILILLSKSETPKLQPIKVRSTNRKF